MHKLNIDQKKFKNISDKLRSQLAINNNPNHSQMLQFLAQAMFSKPYEEVKETILKDINVIKVFSCKNEDFIFNKKGVLMARVKTKNDIDLKKFINTTRMKCDKIEKYYIPFYDEERFFDSKDEYIKNTDGSIIPSVSYVLSMATCMGYLFKNSIFDLLENSKSFEFSAVYENGSFESLSNEQLCGDWFQNVESEGQDALCLILEFPNGEEFYLSFKDLLLSRYESSDNSYIIDFGSYKYVLKF